MSGVKKIYFTAQFKVLITHVHFQIVCRETKFASYNMSVVAVPLGSLQGCLCSPAPVAPVDAQTSQRRERSFSQNMSFQILGVKVISVDNSL